MSLELQKNVKGANTWSDRLAGVLPDDPQGGVHRGPHVGFSGLRRRRGEFESSGRAASRRRGPAAEISSTDAAGSHGVADDRGRVADRLSCGGALYRCDISLYGISGSHLGFDEMVEAVCRQVEGAVAMMGHDSEML